MTLLKRIKNWFWPPSPESESDRLWREATERWRAHNAEKRAAGCPCGKPATKVRYMHGNVGGVPVEFWTCDEHEGMSQWHGTSGGIKPFWPRPMACQWCQISESCGGWSGPRGGPPTVWDCPIRPEPVNFSKEEADG